jgi:hypothetical protein
LTEKPTGYFSKKDKYGKNKVHPVFESHGAQRREPRAQIYSVQQQAFLDDNVKGYTVKFSYKDGRKEKVHLLARDYEEALEGSLWKITHEQGVKHHCRDVQEITIEDPDLGEVLHKIGAGARRVATGAYRTGRGFVRGLPRVAHGVGEVAGTPEAMREQYRLGKQEHLPVDIAAAQRVGRARRIEQEARWDKAEIMRLVDQSKSSDITVRATALGYLKRYYPEVYSELERAR